ncbi:MAG: archease [Candidatus Krumholzibacteriota bacterium]|nr:archease [Candidatus Krumholzibacteriota bacterium]
MTDPRTPRAWTEPFGADLALRASAGDVAGAFAAAALALGRVLAGGERRAAATRPLALAAGDREGLLAALLEEVLVLFETEGLLPAAVEIARLTATRLEGTLRADRFDAARHEPGRAVKAVTWHRLKVREDAAGASIHAVLDL